MVNPLRRTDVDAAAPVRTVIDMHENVNVNSVARAIHILEILDGSRRGLNISEIGRRLGIPKSSAHLIILTLENLGYLVKSHSHRYELSLKAYGLGRERMESLGLPHVALPIMKSLATQTRLTIHLCVLDGQQGVIVQKVDGASLARFDTYAGKRMNLHCTAAGKVLLAYASGGTLKHVLSKTVFMRHTRNTITSTLDLQRALKRIRETGYGIDDEEEELGVRCVAAPILGPASECVAAVSVTGTLEEIVLDRLETIVNPLRQAVARIHLALSREESAAS